MNNKQDKFEYINTEDKHIDNNSNYKDENLI